MTRRLVVAVVIVALSGGFYLLLIDTVDGPELYAMAGVLVLTLLAFAISAEQGISEASVRPAWLLRVWRPLYRAPAHIVLVSLAALAQLIRPRAARGRFHAVPFNAGQSGRDRGRIALAESLGSFTPNTIVLGVDADRDLLLVHELVARDEEPDVLGLGSEP